MYADDRLNNIQAQINRLTDLKRGLRERERSIDARRTYLNKPGVFAANNVKTLRDSLMGALPNHMMPGNVGGLNEVCWPFYFQASVDFGSDPTIQANNYKSSYFQVDQEAGFLLLSIGVSFMTDSVGASAIANAPVQIELIDRQSSRRFANDPIPLQMFGGNSLPSVFPTPFYMQPNAFLDIKANGMLETAQDFTGSGLFKLSFFGYRIRTEDAGKVLSTIFAP